MAIAVSDGDHDSGCDGCEGALPVVALGYRVSDVAGDYGCGCGGLDCA